MRAERQTDKQIETYRYADRNNSHSYGQSNDENSADMAV